MYDLHKHVETHNDSDAYSCDVEGCGFISRTLQTLKQHYRRVHVVSILNSRIKYLAINEAKFHIYMPLVSCELMKCFIFCIKSSIYLHTFLGLLQVLCKFTIHPYQ